MNSVGMPSQEVATDVSGEGLFTGAALTTGSAGVFTGAAGAPGATAGGRQLRGARDEGNGPDAWAARAIKNAKLKINKTARPAALLNFAFLIFNGLQEGVFIL